MSYDFIMMRPRAKIRAAADLDESALAMQAPEDILSALSQWLAEIVWRQDADGGRFGSLIYDGDRYEFRLPPEPDLIWQIHTSYRAGSRSLIDEICRRMELIAFDGQQNTLIGASG